MSGETNHSYLKNHLFLAGASFVGLGLMSLFFLVVAWFLGGNAFFESLYGKETMMALLVGIGVGISLMLAFREQKTPGTPPKLGLHQNKIAGEHG
jgi:hypothetical protein